MSIENKGFAPLQEPSQESGQENEAKPLEIERKFKVKEMPDDLERYPKKKIVQGYTEILDNGSETRVRKTENPDGTTTYVKTTKSGGGEIRSEEEYEISKETFDALWSHTDGRVVEKTRYEIPYSDNGKDYKIELDVFDGNLEGLISVEVEFANSEDSKNFTSPEWFGEDISENKDYKNKTLAVKGLPSELRTDLERELDVENQEIADLQSRLDDAAEEFRKVSNEYYNQGIQWDIGYVASLGRAVKDLEDEIKKAQNN